MVWIGTQNGLNLLNPKTNEFKHFYIQDGLSHNMVRNIFGGQYGRIWLHCESEISMLDIKNMQFFNYGYKEGLVINRQCSYISPKGEIILGGRNKGFYAFYPENIFHNAYINTPVHITGLKIYNKPVQPGDKNSPLQYNITETKNITLEPEHDIVSFEFSALNFLNSSQQRYVYKLEGYDKKWIQSDVPSHAATYTQLPPGNYVFHVKRINDKGIYDKGTSISVKVLPPWYRTNFAMLIYLLILGLIIVGVIKVISLRNKQKITKVKAEKQHEIDQLKIRFFMNVSHEFSTVLSLILDPVKRLKKQMNDIKDNKIKESLSLIERMSEKLKRLVNQLMDIRKLDAGSQKLSLTNDDLVPFIKSIYQIFIDIANQRKIKYTFQSQRNKINGWFDSDKLEKIIYNLLSNAFKYTNIGDSITLKLSIEKDDKGNEFIEISVKDTGVGIKEKDLNKIFERFYQVHNVHQQEVGGIGIGLSLVNELVKLYRGEIHVNSILEKGSVFKVKLPISKALFNEEELMDEAKTKQTTTSSSEVVMEEIGTQLLSKNKPRDNVPWKASKDDILILMVEDNVELQKYIGELLEQQFKVVKAYNGREAIRMIDNTMPDLIIADVLMPEMDGFEMCKKIKSNPKSSHIPVILLTARKQNEDKIKGFKAGADAYITKPFDLDLLLIRIQNLLSSRKMLKDKFHKNLLSDSVENNTLTTANEEFMYKLMGIIEKNIDNPSLSISDLVSEMNMGRTNLFNKVKSITGVSVNELIRKIRLNRAALLLQTKKYTVAQVTNMTGFRNSSYFIKCFKEQFDQYPSKYMKRT
jgi:signal transduction histidine kinase/DNA-binding response OmpR family regulator